MPPTGDTPAGAYLPGDTTGILKLCHDLSGKFTRIIKVGGNRRAGRGTGNFFRAITNRFPFRSHFLDMLRLRAATCKEANDMLAPSLIFLAV